jgi:hypothetical protein
MHLSNLVVMRNRFFRKYKKFLLISLAIFGIYKIFLSKITTSNQNETLLRQLIESENDQGVNTNSYMQVYARYRLVKQREGKNFTFLKKTNANGRFKQTNQKNYLILQYTTIFGRPRLCTTYNQLNQQMFVDECPYKNCAFTCNKAEFNNSHAILFHESDIASEINRDSRFIKDSIRLHASNPEKIFVLYNDEANPVIDLLDDIKFNWTMSYRLDAEVSDCSYGCYYKTERHTDEAQKDFYRAFEKDFNERKSEALWFVSNCLSKYRIDFANGLSEFIKLNVFGSCKSVRTFRKGIKTFAFHYIDMNFD